MNGAKITDSEKVTSEPLIAHVEQFLWHVHQT